MYRPRVRLNTGCLTCRSRRKKCDELRPVCNACQRLELQCYWPSTSAHVQKPSEVPPWQITRRAPSVQAAPGRTPCITCNILGVPSSIPMLELPVYGWSFNCPDCIPLLSSESVDLDQLDKFRFVRYAQPVSPRIPPKLYAYTSRPSLALHRFLSGAHNIVETLFENPTLAITEHYTRLVTSDRIFLATCLSVGAIMISNSIQTKSDWTRLAVSAYQHCLLYVRLNVDQAANSDVAAELLGPIHMLHTFETLQNTDKPPVTVHLTVIHRIISGCDPRNPPQSLIMILSNILYSLSLNSLFQFHVLYSPHLNTMDDLLGIHWRLIGEAAGPMGVSGFWLSMAYKLSFLRHKLAKGQSIDVELLPLKEEVSRQSAIVSAAPIASMSRNSIRIHRLAQGFAVSCTILVKFLTRPCSGLEEPDIQELIQSYGSDMEDLLRTDEILLPLLWPISIIGMALNESHHRSFLERILRRICKSWLVTSPLRIISLLHRVWEEKKGLWVLLDDSMLNVVML